MLDITWMMMVGMFVAAIAAIYLSRGRIEVGGKHSVNLLRNQSDEDRAITLYAIAEAFAHLAACVDESGSKNSKLMISAFAIALDMAAYNMYGEEGLHILGAEVERLIFNPTDQ